MRVVAALAFLAVIGAGVEARAAAKIELEAGGGINFGPTSPLATARLGVDFLNSVAVSLRGQAALGHDFQGCFGGGCSLAPVSAYRGWALFPELRLRAPTPIIQPDLAIGIGVGDLISFADGGRIVPNKTPGTKFYVQLGIGVRIGIPTTSIYLRPEFSVSLWTHATGPDVTGDSGKGTLPVYNLQLVIGYSTGL